jgi:hypothetical protein
LTTPKTAATENMSFIKNLFFGKKPSYSESSHETVPSAPSHDATTDTPITVAAESEVSREGASEGGKKPVVISPPPKNNLSQHQNAGMLAGGVIGEVTEHNAGAGMVDGLVAGNIISQKANQIKKQAYWKEQAQNYKAGEPAAGVGDERVSTPAQGRDRKRSEGRDERRKARWDRRAERSKD